MKNGLPWWFPYLQLAAVILIPVVVLPLMRSLRKVRENELAHLKEAIDDLGKRLDRSHDSLNRRIEDVREQMITHFRWHGEHRP